MKKISRYFLLGLLAVSGSVFSQNPKTHVIERLTFTDCGECPCLDSIIYTCMTPALKHSVVLQYHTRFSGLYTPGFDSIDRNLIRDGSDLRTNRDGYIYNYVFFINIHQVCDSALKYLQNDTVANVKIQMKSKTWDPLSRTLNFSADLTPYRGDLSGAYMVNAVITENNIIYIQQHHDTCGIPFGHEGRYLVTHHDVCRKMSYEPYGDTLVRGNWPASQTISRNFSLKIDSSWNPSNCNVILYAYKLENELGNSRIQQALKQSVTWPLDIDTRSAPQSVGISIIPNPAANRANAQIRLPEGGIAEISIIDLSGKPILKIAHGLIVKDLYNVEFDLGSISNGQYIFNILLNGKSYSSKFTVKK